MKYQGNKRRIVNDFLPILIDEMKGKAAFVDAFCGSCSVIENVPSHFRRIANDNNRYLIEMWKSLLNGKEFITHIDKETYSRARDCFHGKNNDFTDDEVGWIGFMASFNGMLRRKS